MMMMLGNHAYDDIGALVEVALTRLMFPMSQVGNNTDDRLGSSGMHTRSVLERRWQQALVLGKVHT